MLVKMFILFLIFGKLLLVFSMSPYFSLFGVLLQAMALAGAVCYYEMPFFSLMVILIYVGGMLIVFLFSTMLCAERYPEMGFLEVLMFGVGLVFLFCPLISVWDPSELSCSWVSLKPEVKLGELFGCLGLFTCLMGVILLLALVVVLVLSFEHSKNALRKL